MYDYDDYDDDDRMHFGSVDRMDWVWEGIPRGGFGWFIGMAELWREYHVEVGLFKGEGAGSEDEYHVEVWVW